MLDAKGNEFTSFTVGNGRFFINNQEVPLWKYLEEKAEYEGRTYVTFVNQPSE